MKKLFFSIFFVLFFFVSTKNIFADASPTPPQEEFFRAKVIAITNQGEIINDSGRNTCQEVNLKILEGDSKNKEIVVEYGKDSALTKDQLVSTGQTIIVEKITDEGQKPTYQITDRYRVNQVVPTIIIFFALIIILS